MKLKIATLLNVIYPPSLSLIIKEWKNKIYSLWLSKQFNHFGINARVYYSIVLKGGRYISIGNNSHIGARSFITAWNNASNSENRIIIGNCVWIGENAHITAVNKIEIGNSVLMGKNVTITDNDHGKTNMEALKDPPIKRELHSKGVVKIEDNVWIGDKATILSGVHIGENSIIAANSVVTKDVPKNTIVGGIPATIIKKIEAPILGQK